MKEGLYKKVLQNSKPSMPRPNLPKGQGVTVKQSTPEELYNQIG